MNATLQENPTRGSGHWAYVPVGLMILMVGGLLTMARLAADDPGFSVERDYYKKAVGWDAEMAQERENERLGWSSTLDLHTIADGRTALTFALRDRAGNPIANAKIGVEAFYNARASNVVTAELVETERGYLTELSLEPRGLWEFQFRAQVGKDRFTTIVRKDLGESR